MEERQRVREQPYICHNEQTLCTVVPEGRSDAGICRYMVYRMGTNNHHDDVITCTCLVYQQNKYTEIDKKFLLKALKYSSISIIHMNASNNSCVA